MNPNSPKEKEDFYVLIKRAASKVARTATADIVDGYYDYLKDFPLDLIERAINHAYRNRDPDDIFLLTQMVSSLEIEKAANGIVEEENRTEHAMCPKCEGRMWIIEERKDGRVITHPCECLYDKATKALVMKSSSVMGKKNSRYWKTIVRSYETYQKR